MPPQRNDTSSTKLQNQIVNETYIKSTAVGGVTEAAESTSPTEDLTPINIFRNAFAVNKVKLTTQWWQRTEPRNLTMNLHALNLPNFRAKTDNSLPKDKEEDSPK